MADVENALREDPYTICLLEDSGHELNKYCQITTFARNLIKPEIIGKYLCFAPYSTEKYSNKYVGHVTDTGILIDDKGLTPKYNYVVQIVSEVEFRIKAKTIQQLCNLYMPAWGVKAYLSYFSDRTTGVLLFLRVYKIDEAIDLKYTSKGMRGSYQVFNLYDDQGNLISIEIDGVTPVLSDSKFKYLKHEIIHSLKVDGAFIAEYDTSQESLLQLADRFEADKLIKGTHKAWENIHLKWQENGGFDIAVGEDFDMAKIDYNAIFLETLKVCPNMKLMIEYAKAIQAARLGEYNYLLKDVHARNKNASKAAMRLFDMSFRLAIKAALYAYKDDGIDLEDAFQVACEGVWNAIWRHTDAVEKSFSSYASMWIYQKMHRELPYFQTNFRLPVHFLVEVANVWDELIKNCGEININTISPQDLKKLLIQYTECDDDSKNLMMRILIPFESVERLIESTEQLVSEYGFMEDDLYLGDFTDEHEERSLFEEVSFRLFKEQLDDVLATITPREQTVIRLRFGLDDDKERTLEEVGQYLNVTRERIRQIEAKALRKLKHPSRSKKLKDFLDD